MLFRSNFRRFINLDEPDRNYDQAVGLIKKDEYGRVWVVFFGGGLQAFKVQKGTLVHIKKYDLNIQSPQTLINVSKEHLIVGTEGKGIIEVYFGNEIRRSVISGSENTNVLDMSSDKDGRLWVATASEGIKLFSGDLEPIIFSEDNGLPNNTVYSIIYDSVSNKVWATTNKGMISLDPINHKISHYGYYDGLQGDEFIRAGFKSTSGHIYFGGINGFNRFFPYII